MIVIRMGRALGVELYLEEAGVRSDAGGGDLELPALNLIAEFFGTTSRGVLPLPHPGFKGPYLNEGSQHARPAAAGGTPSRTMLASNRTQ